MNADPDPERVAPRRFWLVRRQAGSDGVVAEGTLWSSGQAALHWPGQPPVTLLWASADDLLAIHARDSQTTVEWLDNSNDWRCEHIECVEYDRGAIWIH